MRYFAKCAALGLAAACTLFLSACGKDKEITYLEQEPFESSVGGFSAQYLSQYQFANEAAASMVRMERKQALQNLTPNFKDWHVKLLYVSTDSDGDALVKFRSVTNPNIMYDLSVDHGSEFYPTVASLHLNDDAYISGFFKSGDDTDGFRELSFTEKGSMIAPEFKITISAISTSAPAVVSEGAAASAGAGDFEDSPQSMLPEASSQNSIPAQSGDLRTMSCNQLWYARNSIFAEKGKCFKTQRAIAAFGPRCHPPYGDLTQSEKIRVSEISYWEGQAGCSLN